MVEASRFTSILDELRLHATAGYAIALHVRFTTPTYLFQTYPEVWSEHYSAAGLVMQDPTVAWAFQNTGTIRWSDLAAQDAAGVFAAAAAHGLVHGVTLSLDRAGSRSLASFSRGDRDFTDAEIAAILPLAEELHDLTTAGTRLPEATHDHLRRLSVRFTQP